jgi:ribosomal protein S18 acetylase RimI-like enzyme
LTEQVVLRDLTSSDAEAFRDVRLRALKNHPQSFAAAYEDEKDFPLEKTAEFLNQPSPDRFILGALVDDALVGIVGGNRDAPKKAGHKAHIGGMYVLPEARGQGIGRLMLVEAIRRLRAMDGIEDIILAVTVGNDSAHALYASMGFERSYIDPRYFKIDGVYYDVEWMCLRV